MLNYNRKVANLRILPLSLVSYDLVLNFNFFLNVYIIKQPFIYFSDLPINSIREEIPSHTIMQGELFTF